MREITENKEELENATEEVTSKNIMETTKTEREKKLAKYSSDLYKEVLENIADNENIVVENLTEEEQSELINRALLNTLIEFQLSLLRLNIQKSHEEDYKNLITKNVSEVKEKIKRVFTSEKFEVAENYKDYVAELVAEENNAILDHYRKQIFPSIRSSVPKGIPLPVDNINPQLREITSNKDKRTITAEEIIFNDEISTAKNGTNDIAKVKTEIRIPIDIYAGLEIKNIDIFDTLVLNAVGGLCLAYDDDNKYISISQIYRAMGYGNNSTSTPNTNMKNKILNSLRKLRAYSLHIDNKSELTANYKRELFDAEDSILSWRMASANINGVFVEEAIRINSFPLSLLYALQRNQLRMTHPAFYTTKISKTETILSVMTYLIRRFYRGKLSQDKAGYEIKWETLFDNIGEASATKRKKDTIKTNTLKLLDDWKERNIIKKYTNNNNKLIINLTENFELEVSKPPKSAYDILV